MPRSISRRGWIVLALVALVVVIAFSLVMRFYNAEGGSHQVGGLGPSTQSGVIVTLEPVSIDALRSQATVHLTFASQGQALTDSSGRLTQNTRVAIDSLNGIQEAKFLAGEPIGQMEAVIALDGEQANYPFDRHAGTAMITADTYSKQPDGSILSTGSLPVGLQGQGGVNGWDTTLDLPTAMADSAFAKVTFNRAFSTQVFALLLLVMVLLLAIMALVVGILVQTNRRRVEAGLLGWAAALLFALPLLRNYMPNAPPIGASIDIFVYLWVIVMAVIGLVLIVMAWIVQSRAGLIAEHSDVDSEGR